MSDPEADALSQSVFVSDVSRLNISTDTRHLVTILIKVSLSRNILRCDLLRLLNWFRKSEKFSRADGVVYTDRIRHQLMLQNYRYEASVSRCVPVYLIVPEDRIRQCGTSSESCHKDRTVSVSRHFLLQAPQCPCSVRKRFSRDHCCRERSKPGCRIVGSHSRWELTTWADFQLCLHRLLMSSAGCKSNHSGFLAVSRRNSELSMWGWIGQLSCVTKKIGDYSGGYRPMLCIFQKLQSSWF